MKQKRASVIAIGQNKSEIKIYCLHRADGYTFRQCCWYEMGCRQVKIFKDLNAAKLFAQQKSVALANGLAVDVAVSYRDVEILRACEQQVSRFGTTLPAAIEEWAAARDVSGKGIARRSLPGNSGHRGPLLCAEPVTPFMSAALD